MRRPSQKKLMLMGVVFLFLFLLFSGCELLKTEKDHLTVNVMTAVFLTVLDERNQQITQNMDGAAVSIEIIKNGKDRFVYDRIMQKGICQATASFTLYKGQFIECSATVPKGYLGFYPIAPATSRLTWETAESQATLTGTYNWYTDLIILMRK